MVYCIFFSRGLCVPTGSWEPKETPTLYMFINCSTRELSVIEQFVVFNFLLTFLILTSNLVYIRSLAVIIFYFHLCLLIQL